MGTEIALPPGDPMKSFEEKVIEKLRTDIGDMIPDDVLAGLVQKAVEEQFFKPVIQRDQYERIASEKPSWFVQEVVKVAEPVLKEYVKKHIGNWEGEITKAVHDFLKEENLLLMVMAAMRQQTLEQIEEVTSRLIDRYRQGGGF